MPSNFVPAHSNNNNNIMITTTVLSRVHSHGSTEAFPLRVFGTLPITIITLFTNWKPSSGNVIMHEFPH